MKATEELRRMLDERGIEWGNVRDDGSESDHLTEWEFEGIQSYAVATEWPGGLSLETHQHYLTPAQAIAATMGDETCHDKCSSFNAWACSECNATVLLMFDDFCEPSYSVDGIADVPRFCPNCGRKVVGE